MKIVHAYHLQTMALFCENTTWTQCYSNTISVHNPQTLPKKTDFALNPQNVYKTYNGLSWFQYRLRLEAILSVSYFGTFISL